jgi:small subunit ribosomal protein S17
MTKTTTKTAARTTGTKPGEPVVSAKGTRTGTVDSDARRKTRRVVVSYLAKHPKYGKYLRKRTVLHVHDEREESHVGDIVEVAPCRRRSRTKTWTLVRVVEKRSAASAALESVKRLGSDLETGG